MKVEHGADASHASAGAGNFVLRAAPRAGPRQLLPSFSYLLLYSQTDVSFHIFQYNIALQETKLSNES